MDLKVFPDYNAMSSAAAQMIIDRVNEKPNAFFGFATGDTPRLTYQLVTEMAKRERVDFSKCFIVGLDEWLGIPPDNSGSCHHFLHKYLFQPLNIDPSQFHLFNSMTTDEEEECKKMNKLIEDRGTIDFMVVGIGMNGHIGFNEPGTDVHSMAHVSTLDDTTRTVGRKYFQEEVSLTRGITLGLNQVMQSKTLLMMANGKKKAPVIKKVVEKEISNSLPASLIRRHNNGILMIDTEASAELESLDK
jgi:glucosamine-6-phosphate isomerase